MPFSLGFALFGLPTETAHVPKPLDTGQAKGRETNFRIRDEHNGSIEGDHDGGKQVDQDYEHSNNIALLSFGWGVVIFEQSVQTAHHLVHDSPEDSEKL